VFGNSLAEEQHGAVATVPPEAIHASSIEINNPLLSKSSAQVCLQSGTTGKDFDPSIQVFGPIEQELSIFGEADKTKIRTTATTIITIAVANIIKRFFFIF
jgi:hypothetical protein